MKAIDSTHHFTIPMESLTRWNSSVFKESRTTPLHDMKIDFEVCA